MVVFEDVMEGKEWREHGGLEVNRKGWTARFVNNMHMGLRGGVEGGEERKGKGVPDRSKASQRILTSCLTVVPFTSHLGVGE